MKTFFRFAPAAVMTLAGLGALMVDGASAYAETHRTECSGETCHHLVCDDAGNGCMEVSGFSRYDHPYYGHFYQTNYVCDGYGYGCHYVHVRGFYDGNGDWHSYSH